MYPNVEDIARQELKEGRPLLDAGWQMETLSALLELDFKPSIEFLGPPTKFRCDSCSGYIYGKVSVQPHWQSILENIKDGIHLQSFCSDIQEEQFSDSQGHSTITNQGSPIYTTGGNDLSPNRTLQEEEAAPPDEESSTREDDTSSITPDREEVWCIWCWHRFKETGCPLLPEISKTQLSDGDDSSEDDFSPFLFNT